ncbi:hypothetical protein IGI04_034774 [Brassica rapa subsp. trilocularis]|uniref:Uncharacterized protein n=1 Tax=Brassica rapa subsp. trilocularis TaxID=1813537 RepID=A0ABQ7L9R6_BRACM|nr:hypothetical protein IGI04_034774 [Brassica rapa subsp. trilocularis]
MSQRLSLPYILVKDDPSVHVLMHDSNDKDSCGTVRMVCRNVEMVGKDEFWYGQFGCLDVVPALALFWTYAGRSGTRLGQSDRYGWMDEPQLNCSERPDLHAELVPYTDMWTGAHQFGFSFLSSSQRISSGLFGG